MPNGFSHHALTRLALENAPVLFPPELAQRLIGEFSLYPDYALAGRGDAKNFVPSSDGIPFHYLRDTSFEFTYRHYARNSEGEMVRCGNFVNPHYDFTVSAFTRLLSEALGHFGNGDRESAAKTTGVLLHLLQDHTFGVHALEGLGGTDVYYFDRLKIWPESPVRTLCALRPPEELAELPRRGMALGDTVPEAALRLYHRMCRANRHARTLCVKTLLGESDTAHEMAKSSALACSDALASLHALKCGWKAEPGPVSLAEFEPYEISHQVWGNEFPDRFEFAVPIEEHLFFRFPEEVFSQLSAEITAEKALAVESVLDGKMVDRISLPEKHAAILRLSRPHGLCGFRFIAQESSGLVSVKKAVLDQR